MNNHSLHHLWLAESIRLTELQSGPLEDTEANRQARMTNGDIGHKIIIRAHLLAQRDGLITAQQLWLSSARLTGALLLLLSLCIGGGLALTVLGDASRPVNIFWAVGSLLGIHLLLLLMWIMSLLLPENPGSLLGRLWLWLTEKFSRSGRKIQLAPALLILLNRQRATRWVIGILLHALWLLTLASALIVMLTLLATKHYLFTWETTLLSSDTVVTLTRTLGVLPNWIGFPQPDIEVIKASGNQGLDVELVRYSWAGWLIGVVTVYGLFPRVLCLILCVSCWLFQRQRLSLDIALPENQLLAERLQPSSEQLGITDTDPGESTIAASPSLRLTPHGNILIAIELDDNHHWPPQFTDNIEYAGMLNDRSQRNALLDQLQLTPAARLLIVCDPHRSPDRGTLRLIAELANKSTITKIWLIDDQPCDPARLAHWHDALKQLKIEEADLHWLENTDE